jgi:hypothetical protein
VEVVAAVEVMTAVAVTVTMATMTVTAATDDLEAVLTSRCHD